MGQTCRTERYSMPALGQNQTSEGVQAMSALPPKADIETQSLDVRFVPKADSCSAAKWSLCRPGPHHAASDCLAARIVVSVDLHSRSERLACFVVQTCEQLAGA